MYKHSLAVLLASLVLTGCLKKETGCQYKLGSYTVPVAEQEAVAHYLDSIGIQATKHSSGLYYQVVNSGSGDTVPNLCSQIQINYKGQFTSGKIFDQQNNAVFVLGSLIEGWKRGIPLIRKGGQIKLYIPPSLGYGNTDIINNGVVIIPGKSILIFDITLIDYIE